MAVQLAVRAVAPATPTSAVPDVGARAVHASRVVLHAASDGATRPATATLLEVAATPSLSPVVGALADEAVPQDAVVRAVPRVTVPGAVALAVETWTVVPVPPAARLVAPRPVAGAVAAVAVAVLLHL